MPRAATYYQAQEFAELAGVTVRTLHHYDRIGLLRPSGHTSAGYRLYSERDLIMLQQIVTLKFIGFSLKQIKEICQREDFDLARMLAIQQQVLARKKSQLELAIAAIEKASALLRGGTAPDVDTLRNIIKVINMQSNMEWIKRYYSEEQLANLARRATPELLAKAQQDWTALIKEVEASLDVDPASEKAQALAARWAELVQEFTQGDAGIEASLKRLYADEANWPATFPRPFSGEVAAFISRAMAARSKPEGSED